MTENPTRIRVVVVDDNADTINNLKKLLYFEKDVEIVGTASSGEEGIACAVEKLPDVVLMDINMPGMDGISASKAITARLPGVQIIIMSVQAEADYLRRAMLAGAREFLIKPFSSEQLANTLRAVYQLSASSRGAVQKPAALVASLSAQLGVPKPAPQAVPAATHVAAPAAHPPIIPVSLAPHSNGSRPHANADAGERRGRILVVYSANGGIGRSTVAVNLALALKDETKAKVALVDCSLRFGDVGVMLNMVATHTIADAFTPDGALDAEILPDMLTTHPSGLKVLLAPASPELAELISSKAIRQVMATLREKYEYIIVDTSSSLDETTLSVLDMADQILLLTTSEIPSIKNTKLFFEVTEALNYTADKTLLVVSKFDLKSTVTAQDIQASVKHPVYALIERDDRAATQAIQTGQPFVANQRSAAATVAINRLAKQLTRSLPEMAETAQPARKRLFR
jgi:pilus assembly protein CpaE